MQTKLVALLSEYFRHIRHYMIYLLTAIGLPTGGNNTVYRTTQLTTLVGRLSGIRTQSSQTKINDELTA